MARTKQTQYNKSQMLFISHASSDEDLVRCLVDMLQKSFSGITKNSMRCTSYGRYKLPLGETARERLPEDIRNSIVICVITPKSISRPWVLFEAGAAWGLTKKIIPLLHGVKHDELPGALQGTTAAYADRSQDLAQIIDEINEELGWTKNETISIDDAKSEFLAHISNVSTRPPEKLIIRSEIIKELPWTEISRIAKKEVYIWGWSGVNAANERTRNTIRKLTSKGIKVNFMILNQENAVRASEFLAFAPICSWSKEGVNKDIEQGKVELQRISESMTPDERRNFHCRETSWLMAWSGVAVDPTEKNGIMQIETYIYNYANHLGEANHLDYRPNLLITNDSKFFRPFSTSLFEMWEKASEINFQ